MANLNLYIFNDKGQTRTRIGKKKKGFFFHNEIVFHNNDSRDALKVDFNPAIIKSITVQPGKSESVTFNAAVGDQVKYTAEITGAKPEDPIIIID